jgi:dephospho-CoA kinase
MMRVWKHNRPKPVVGIAGGIGSGKSTVARQFGELGFVVVDADALAHEVLQTAEVKRALREWLGEGVFAADGSVVRKAVAKLVFNSPEQISKLNGLIHPRVGALRQQMTVEAMGRPEVRGVVWDIPLLFEIGLEQECDAVVFVDAPVEVREQRLREKRGWGREELARREKLQIPLDKKAEVADYCIDNSGNEAHSLPQILRVLSQLFTTSGE